MGGGLLHLRVGRPGDMTVSSVSLSTGNSGGEVHRFQVREEWTTETCKDWRRDRGCLKVAIYEVTFTFLILQYCLTPYPSRPSYCLAIQISSHFMGSSSTTFLLVRGWGLVWGRANTNSPPRWAAPVLTRTPPIQFHRPRTRHSKSPGTKPMS